MAVAAPRSRAASVATSRRQSGEETQSGTAPLRPAPLGCPVGSAATTPEARLDDSRYSRLGGFALESH